METLKSILRENKTSCEIPELDDLIKKLSGIEKEIIVCLEKEKTDKEVIEKVKKFFSLGDFA